MNIEKYETEFFYIFEDIEIMENNPELEKPLWAFVDVRNGHSKWFETQKEAYEYLKEYNKLEGE
tara:strand:- start:449 stop:640 length:192 start_codon:yes stop_codon:yes gene_type:complete